MEACFFVGRLLDQNEVLPADDDTRDKSSGMMVMMMIHELQRVEYCLSTTSSNNNQEV